MNPLKEPAAISINSKGLIHLTDRGDLKSSLRPRHHAKAAKEENYDVHETRQPNNQTCVRKANAVDDQRTNQAKPNRRFGEERLYDPPR